MRILITGASSYVGARLYSDLRKKFDVIGTYNENRLFPELQQLDITQADAVDRLIGKTKPAVIVHVAANPSAAWCKAHPDEAKQVNIEGTKNIVHGADSISARVIYISSIAAIRSSDLYGETKFSSEECVKETKSGYIILRPSLIIGYSPNTSNDRPHNRILKNITEKTTPIYDATWKFQPTWLGHISECIEEIIRKNLTNETIEIAVPEFKSRYDIARDILAHFGIKAIPEDKKEFTQDAPAELDKLAALGLPQHNYSEIINMVVREIRDHLPS